MMLIKITFRKMKLNAIMSGIRKRRFVSITATLLVTMLITVYLRTLKSDVVDIENISEFPVKLRRVDKYRWNYTTVINEELPEFAPGFNETEYNWYVELIRVFDDTCKQYNITYFLIAGSAIGVYTHHGFIPWDDDFDVMVNASQKDIFKLALESVPDHSVHTTQNYMWKFWHCNFSSASRYPWRWPFIDISFFDVNDTHEYDVTRTMPRLFNIKSHIFPLRKGLFESVILPIPGNMEAYLNNRYKMDECYSNSWCHREQRASKYRQKNVPCDTFLNVYPFVHRLRKDSFGYEELRLGNKVLYTLLVD